MLLGLCRVNKGILQRYPGPSPVARDTRWYIVHKKLEACADVRVVKLFKQAIAEVGELWHGADFVAVHRDERPSRPRAWAWVPADPSDPKDIL